LIRGAIAVVRKVRFFKGALHSGAKFHISVGHTTVMASVTFWGAREIAEQAELESEEAENPKTNNKNNQQITLGNSSLGGSADLAGLPRLKFSEYCCSIGRDFNHILPSDLFADRLESGLFASR
jgi:selenocysteine-specific elongation factor